MRESKPVHVGEVIKKSGFEDMLKRVMLLPCLMCPKCKEDNYTGWHPGSKVCPGCEERKEKEELRKKVEEEKDKHLTLAEESKVKKKRVKKKPDIKVLYRADIDG